MPSLTYQVPNSVWARYEKKAQRDGVSVRVWILWKLKALAAEDDDDTPNDELEPASNQAA